LNENGTPIVITLDNFDILASNSSQNILYEIFELTLSKNHSVSFIGLTNYCVMI